MSVKHVQFALDGAPGLNAGQRLTLVSLGEWANDEGICWPSHDTIARRVGVSRRQVIRIIDQLEEKGIVSRVERKQHSNVYQLRCDTAVSHVTSGAGVPDVTPSTHQDVTFSAPDVTSSTSRCDIAMSPEPPIEPSLEPPREPVGKRTDPAMVLVDAWAERRGFAPTNWAKAMKQAKVLVAASCEREELMQVYDYLEADPFWSEKGFDLGIAGSQLERFRQAQRVPKKGATKELNSFDRVRLKYGIPVAGDAVETKGVVIR